jgi:hypothetical protein
VAPPAATLQTDVAALFALFTTARARGGQLGLRSVTNTVAALPFVQEAFRQLGAGGFDVALGFMESLIDREVLLLAAQRDGAAILTEIRTALAAAPATLTTIQQQQLTRSNNMLGLTLGSVAVAPPAAARSRPEKSLTVDTVKLDGSTHDPTTDVALASGIYAQCNVRLVHGVNQPATPLQTTTWLAGDTTLRSANACGTVSGEERTMHREATTAFGLSGRIRAFFVQNFTAPGAVAYSWPPFCATGGASAFRGAVVVRNAAMPEDLGHEIGHVLLNASAHPAGTLMGPGIGPIRLTDTQCATIHKNV